MKNVIIAVILTMFAGSVYADCASISAPGLPKQAKQELVLACEQARLAAMVTPEQATAAVIKEYAAYGQYAKQIAEAVGILAFELGMAVNEFLHTDAGLLVALLLVWKIAGAQLLGFVIGIPLIIAIWILVIKAGKNMFVDTRENITVKARFGGEKVVSVPSYRPFKMLGDDEQVVLWVGTIVAGIITAILLFGLVV